MVYFTSDHHFGHQNIIKYTDRPFESAKQMDKEMIKVWNNIISKEDKVFHLGDFAFAGQERIKEIVSQLNGHIVLIMGNHDRHRTAEWWRKCGFWQVSEFPIIYKGVYILSHEPVFMNEHMPYANIHGHLHNGKMDDNFHCNVGVELSDYKPIPMHEIENFFEAKGGVE